MRKNNNRCTDLFFIEKWIEIKPKAQESHFNWRKSILISIFLVLASHMAVGQKLDSLKSLLSQSTGVEHCDILYQIAYEYMDVDYQLGLNFATKALYAAKKSGDSLRIVKAAMIKSEAYQSLGKMDSSIIGANEILPIARRNNYLMEMKSILNLLGMSYTFLAEYDKTMFIFSFISKL